MTRKHLSPVATSALGAGLLLLALGTVEAHAPGLPEVTELDGGVSEEAATTDTQRAGELTVKAGRSVPAKPEAWQKRPPCLPDVEEALAGACYIRADKKPPCSPALFESGGRCYVAVSRSPRPDTSIDD